MAAVAQPLTSPSIRWSFTWDHDSHDRPLLKVLCLFYTADGATFTRSLKVDYDDGQLYLQSPGIRSDGKNPCTLDLEALEQDLERHFEGKQTLCEVDTVEEVQA